MPTATHRERHFRGTNTVRDIVIGMSDGLTVPFALAAGLSGAAASTAIIVTAGLAEIVAGSIAMGLGGYLAAKTDFEHYMVEKMREARETKEQPEEEAREVAEIFKGYGMTDEQISPILNFFRARPSLWIDFMMRFELGLDRPDRVRGRQSALTIAFSYMVGGLVPLLPYMVFRDIFLAFRFSIVATLSALFIFGFVKGQFTGISALRSAFQTVGIGGLAATAAFAIARLIR